MNPNGTVSQPIRAKDLLEAVLDFLRNRCIKEVKGVPHVCSRGVGSN